MDTGLLSAEAAHSGRYGSASDDASSVASDWNVDTRVSPQAYAASSSSASSASASYRSVPARANYRAALPPPSRPLRSESKHISRNLRLHSRLLYAETLCRPLLCLFVFLSIACFGFFCLVDEPGPGNGCSLCCFGRAASGTSASGSSGSDSDPPSLWILWLALGITGLVGPCFFVFACALCQRPSKRQRMKDDFYADALLEEMLAGDNVTDHYDVFGADNDANLSSSSSSASSPGTGRSSPAMQSRGTIVFFGGLGAPRASTQIHSRAAAEAGYKTIAIDMPSHGTLSAVTFSLARCERVLLRVLRREALLSEQRHRRKTSHARSRAESLRRDMSMAEMSVSIEPVLIAAYGPGAQAAMHVASRRPDVVAGLFLFGPIVDLSSPGMCGCGCCSGYGCFGCGCLFGHGFGCCSNGSALIGNAPCSSIYRMRWANYVEDLMIRRRLRKSHIPEDIKETLCHGREFHLSSAIEWNYDVRKRRLVSELVAAGFDAPICVVAGMTSRDFARALQEVAPQADCRLVSRIGDQYLAVWKFEECNQHMLDFAGNQVFLGGGGGAAGLSPKSMRGGDSYADLRRGAGGV
jgi:hypothetical protein